MNKKIVAFIAIILAYIAVVVAFVLMIFSIGQQYQNLETQKIETVQTELTTILNTKMSEAQMNEQLTTLVHEFPMELIIKDGEQTIFTTFPGVEIDSVRDLFNNDAILYKSQGEAETLNGTYDVMTVLYHTTIADYFNQQFVLLTVYITILVLLLLIIVTMVNRMLFYPLKKIREAIHDMNNFEFSPIEEKDIVTEEFNQFIHKVDTTMQTASKQYTDLELLLLFEHQRLDFLLKISRASLHELKTPLYQTLLTNKELIEFDTDETTQVAVNYNISQADKLLQRINELLKSITANVDSLEDNIECFDVVDLFNTISKDFDVLMDQNNVNIALAAPEQTFVCTNKFALQLIIHNVLANAVTYALSESEIEVDIDLDQEQLIFTCTNETTIENVSRVQSNRFMISAEDVKGKSYRSGNGVYLVKELSKSLGGKAEANADSNSVKVIVDVPTKKGAI